MKQTLFLDRAAMQMTDDGVVIIDRYRKHRARFLIASSIWALFGLASLWRYRYTEDPFQLWSGLTIAISHFFLFIYFFRRTAKRVIPVIKVRKIKFRDKMGRRQMDIKLKNGQTRRIPNAYPHEETIKEHFMNFDIPVED